MKSLQDILHENILASMLFGVYDVMQAAKAPVGVEKIPNSFLWEMIPKGLMAIDAINWFESKNIIRIGLFKSLDAAARMRAFTVTNNQDVTVLKKVKKTIDRALKKGMSFEKWKEKVGATLGDKIGVTFKNPFHMETVFRTNIQASYQAGRFRQMEEVKTLRPYYQYVAVDDDRSREEHAEWNGIVKPADDPFWQSNYPPNGYNCRCTVVSLSQFELERDNLTEKIKQPIPDTFVSEIDGKVKPLRPDEGWEFNPANAFFK